MTSPKSKTIFNKDKDTLIYLLEILIDEIQYKIMNHIYDHIHRDNIYISRYGTLKENIDKMKVSSKEEINPLLINITFILSQNLTNIINYDYTYFINFLLKSSYNFNEPRIEPNFINDEINSFMKVIADKVIYSNNMTLKSLEHEVEDCKRYTLEEIYNKNIEIEINIFKTEIPRKITFLIDFIINLTKYI